MNPLSWIESAIELDRGFSVRLTTTLLHFLWQGAAVALAVCVACRILSQADARSRYAVSLAGLLLMAGGVAITFMLVPRPLRETAEVQTAGAIGSHAALSVQPVMGQAERSELIRAGEPIVSSSSSVSATGRAMPDAIHDGSDAGATDEPVRSKPTSLTLWAPIAAVAYLLGAVFMLSRLALALCGGQRLRKASFPVDDPGLLLIVRQQARRIGLATLPLVSTCERVAVPVVVGVLRPAILLPASLISGLAPDQLQALVTHELAHIRRLDLIANLVQRVIESLLFFHPAAWYVSRRVSAERENCCDDLVISAGCDRVQYAAALVRVAEVYAASMPLVTAHQTALAATGTRPSQFKSRILRLLSAEPRVRLTGFGIALAILTLIALPVVPLALPHWAIALADDDEIRRYSQWNGEQVNQENAPAHVSDRVTAGVIDLYGDSLPQGAVLRLGTERFKGGGRMAYSPDGKLLASAGRRSVRVMDAVTGQWVREVYRIKNEGMRQLATAIAFSHDSRYIAIGWEDGIIKVFTAPEGKEVFSGRHTGHQTSVGDIAFSHSGVLASANWEGGEVILWDVATGDQIHVLTHTSDQPGRDMKLAFSPSGDLLASSCGNNIRIWKLGEKPECAYVAEAQEFEVSHIAFSHGGKTIVAAGHTSATPQIPPQAQLRLWDAETGRPHGELFEELDTYFGALAIRDNGRTLIAATRSQVLLFDLETKSLRRSLQINGPLFGGPGAWAAVAPDGKTLAYAPLGSTIHLLDLETGDAPTPVRESHETMIRAATFSPDGLRIVTGSSDGTMRIWDATDARQVHQLEFSPTCMNLFAVAYSRDGRFVAAAGDYNMPTEPRQVGLVKVWNALTGELCQEFQLEGGAYFNIAFSEDGARIAVAPLTHGYGPQPPVQQSIDIFRIEDGQKLVSLAGHSGTSTAIAFTSGDDALVSVGDDNTIRTWKLPSGELVSTQAVEGAFAAALSPQATTFVMGARDGQLSIRDVRSGEPLHVIQAKSGYGPQAMDISDDGKLLVTSSQGETIDIWDMGTGRELLKLSSPNATVYAVAFDPSGERVVAGMDDGTAIVWDVSMAKNR